MELNSLSPRKGKTVHIGEEKLKKKLLALSKLVEIIPSLFKWTACTLFFKLKTDLCNKDLMKNVEVVKIERSRGINLVIFFSLCLISISRSF